MYAFIVEEATITGGTGQFADATGTFTVNRLLNDATRRAHMLEKMKGAPPGRELQVERRRGLTPEQFRREYFVTGKPVVLEGIAAEWPAVKKWTFEYLAERCGQEDIDVLDGINWKVQRQESAVKTPEAAMKMKDLLAAARSGSSWYGAFMELLDAHTDLRDDIRWSFVRDYGHTRMRIPWQRNILAKMYVGGPMTSTSFHCAPVMNLYLQAFGRKRWVLMGQPNPILLQLGLQKNPTEKRSAFSVHLNHWREEPSRRPPCGTSVGNLVRKSC